MTAPGGIITAAVKHLMAHGVQGDDLLAALADMEAAIDTRSTGAKRQARYRERNKSSQSVTVTPISLEDTSTLASSQTKVCSEAVCSAREVGYHRLPEGWVPVRPLPSKILAKVDQWPPGAIEDELASFHRWAANAENRQGKGRKLDWDKAWASWTERRDGENYGRQGNGNGTGKQQRESSWLAARDFNLQERGP